MMRRALATFAAALLFVSVASVAWASQPPPPPPPPPGSSPPPTPRLPASAFQVCRERSKLLYERSYFFEIRPCTIVATPKGRKLELGSTGGPNTFTDANGKRHRPTKVIFRSFVPLVPPTYEPNFDMFNIKQTGRTLSVRLPNRLPSVLEPYIVTLPRAICREDTWLVSMSLTDGTETKPFGVINSMCGPNAPKKS